jgi:hypothetical protein
VSEEGDNSTQKEPERKKRLVSDTAAFVIALVIIGSFVILTFFLLLHLRNIEHFKEASAVFGAWVGLVIGYFFGSRKVEELINKVDRYMEEADITAIEYEEELDELEEKNQGCNSSYNKAKSELQYIAGRYHQHLDKELLERLKNDHGIII